MFEFSKINDNPFEQLIQVYNKAINLKGFMCINSTNFGPAIGGIRIWPYKDENEAIHDVINLASAMTKKAICAGVSCGGAKTVIMVTPAELEELKNDVIFREVFFRAIGRFIAGLGGRYYVAEDVNTTVHDMDVISHETSYVVGTSSGVGNPGIYTAHGVMHGIQAGVEAIYRQAEFNNLTFAIQGIGNVGFELAKLIHSKGGNLLVSDIDKSNSRLNYLVDKYNATYLEPTQILSAKCDIFVPCALGGVVTDDNISQLKCKIIAGSANNVLENSLKHSQLLAKNGILYLPDYIINAGGLISVSGEVKTGQGKVINSDAIFSKIQNIYGVTRVLIKQALANNISPVVIADEMYHKKNDLYSKVNDIYVAKH